MRRQLPKPSTSELVSVVIPTFNSEATICYCLDSVLNQTHHNLEIIVVDDSSNDGSLTLLDSYAKKDSRIRIIRRPDNAGRPAVPRNEGIAVASGSYIAFLDSDDIWFPSKLERQLQAFASAPEVSLIHSVLYESRKLRPGIYGLLHLSNPQKRRSSLRQLQRQNTIQCSSVLVRREALEAVGGFDEDPNLCAVEDYALWLVFANHFKLGFVPEIQGIYLRRKDSISSLNNWNTRHTYLYRSGLACLPSAPKSSVVRGVRKFFDLPPAIFEYFVRAKLREHLGKPPRCLLN